MNKTMKKILTLSILAIGMAAVSRTPAHASYDYETSTWLVRFMAYVSTASDPSKTPGTAGGVTAGGAFDVTRVFLSTGPNIGAYFVCVDSLPLTATTGGTPAYNLANFAFEDYLFPAIPFIPSTAAITTTGFQLDLRDPVFGGGRTVKKGLTCFVVGDTGNRYWWSIETAQPATRRPY